jgi:signal transduction histidine kinase
MMPGDNTVTQPSSRAARLQQVGSAAAGIAHDINNQLTLIVNHLSLPDVDGARRAVDRCSSLTTSLLAYCRGEAAETGSVSMDSFFCTFLAEVSLPENVRVCTDIPAGLPLIASDPVALTRALTNLISNACDAMNGEGTITISASPCTIEIADSGPGIPPELATSIFEPFFSTKDGRGAGLGLAIVRDIMRQHGGSVTLQSRVGEGARFMLKFRTP